MLETQTKTKRESWIEADWRQIRRTLIAAAIINAAVGIYLIFTMYQTQKLIIYRLDKVEANQEALNAEIINIYSKR